MRIRRILLLSVIWLCSQLNERVMSQPVISQDDLHRVQAMEATEGDGARVKRLFPTSNYQHHDPFVLMDEFFVEPPAGFPTHPHRGFEAITYMLEGGFRHKDNMGNDTTVYAGGIQAFSAGRGLHHSEMPGTEGMNHGIQLWINLPSRLKSSEPRYYQYDAKHIPETKDKGALIRTIVGPDAPLKLHNELVYRHYTISNSYENTIEVPHGFHGFIYVLEGTVDVSDASLPAAEAFFFEAVDALPVKCTGATQFIFLAGKPHGERIRQRGPFVD